LDLNFFVGKQEKEKKHELGKSGSIVLHLIKNYLGKGHVLYLDNWYTSPKLFLKLAEKGVGAVGTVRKNRKLYPKFPPLKKGQKIVKHTKKMFALT